MTTIAYNHKDRQIAVDSRVTKGDIIASDNYNKISKANGYTFVLAGAAADIELVTESFPAQLTEQPQISGYVVAEEQCHYLIYKEDGTPSTLAMEFNDSCGSGGDYALAAMDLGCSAKEAVKCATKRDTHSGGRIRVINLEDL